MAISDQLTEIYNNVPLVYEAGYNKGKVEPFIGIIWKESATPSFQDISFSEGCKLALEITRTNLNSIAYIFFNAQNLNSIKLTYNKETDSAINFEYAFRNNYDLTKIDLSEFRNLKISSLNYAFMSSSKIVSIIGALDLSQCTNTNQAFNGCSSLEDVEIVTNTIPISISFLYSNKLTKASINSIVNGLNSTAAGQILTLSLDAVNKAFETSEGANDGSTSAEWLNLIRDKTDTTKQYYWVITLS